MTVSNQSGLLSFATYFSRQILAFSQPTIKKKYKILKILYCRVDFVAQEVIKNFILNKF